MIDFSSIPHASGVYAILNTFTGECYIGSAVDMHVRCKRHAYLLENGRHDQRKLAASFAVHGEASFRFEILEAVPAPELCTAESLWLKFKSPALNNTMRVIRSRDNPVGDIVKLTIELDPEVAGSLGQIAQQEGRSRRKEAARAVAEYVASRKSREAATA